MRLLKFNQVFFLLMTAAFRAMDPSLEESATMSGANIFQVVWRVTLRLAWPAIFATILILFVRAIESFEVPALLGLPVSWVAVRCSATIMEQRERQRQELQKGGGHQCQISKVVKEVGSSSASSILCP